MEWSKQQQAIFAHVANRSESAVITARAGSGKTTTIIEALRHRARGSSAICVAFNKRIQEELESRIASKGMSNVSAKTMHALGLGALKRADPFTEIDKDKVKNHAKKLLTDANFAKGQRFWNRVRKLGELVSLGKNHQLVGNPQKLEDLAISFGIEDQENPADELALQASTLLEKSALITSSIDFDDMLWLPWVREIPLPKRPLILVDETQDLNPIQLWMASEMVAKDGRILAVGDDRQAIYSWRGATSDALRQVKQTFKATEYKLPVTYRCAKKITALAKKTVPDLECPKDAPEGVVKSVTPEDMLKMVQPGDFILSRLNAPLVGPCLRLLVQGIPSTIAGRDIGKTLSAMVVRSQTQTTADLRRWLDEELRQAGEKLLPEYEDRYQTVADQVNALKVLSEKLTATGEVLKKLELLFSDDNPKHKVVLSSVHKAKGLERERVFLLKNTFNKRTQEEENIWYVGVTRAQRELYLVEG